MRKQAASMITCLMVKIVSLLLTKYNQSIASEQTTVNNGSFIWERKGEKERESWELLSLSDITFSILDSNNL